MGELIVFPDPVVVTIAALEDRLPELGVDVPVLGWIPDARPARFVRVMRAGGTVAGLVIDDALVIVEAWAESDQAAADLAGAARAVVLALRGAVVNGATVYRVEESSGPVNLPDPTSRQCRHTFTVQVSTRGRVPITSN